MIRQELQQKGIIKDVVKKHLEDIDHADELKVPLKVARKKWKHNAGEPWIRSGRLAAFLMRRGYTGPL